MLVLYNDIFQLHLVCPSKQILHTLVGLECADGTAYFRLPAHNLPLIGLKSTIYIAEIEFTLRNCCSQTYSNTISVYHVDFNVFLIRSELLFLLLLYFCDVMNAKLNEHTQARLYISGNPKISSSPAAHTGGNQHPFPYYNLYIIFTSF